MGTFLYRRLLGVVPLLLGVATLVFLVLHIAPGDATAYLFGPGMSQAVIERQRQVFGLDQPLPTQYLRWLGAFARGDLGYSLFQGRPVRDIIAGALPNTLLLTGCSLVLVFLLGIVTGVWQAARHNRASDRVLSVGTLFFYSMPAFWLAVMLMLVFALKATEWGWPLALPPSGITDIDHEMLSIGGRLADRLAHLVLPVATLTLTLAAGVARYTRAQMLDVVRMDYIRTARAKGLPERTVIGRHALRNSLLPIITLLGLYIPFLFSGAVLVERVFAWPGMGTAMFDAILYRDYPVVMAISLIFAALTVLGSLLADILYAVVDPRVRYE
ncbi:MAG: ABC transporter permease [Gemmatimonadota bacterium]